MMSPKKAHSFLPGLPDVSVAEAQASRDRARILKALSSIRAERARGRFVALDEAMGRTSGYLSEVFRGNEKLSLERLMQLIALLGEEASSFFHRCLPRPQRPSPPLGRLPYLGSLEARRKPPAWRDRLLDWGQTFVVSAEGRAFDHDPEELLALRQRDFDRAERLGIHALECFLALSESSLATRSAVPMAKWLSVLGILLRARGDRPMAGELFDLAFRIEARVGDHACRSFLYRNACYLLTDWGQFEEAADFAQRSIDAAVLGADWKGIGLGQYACAVAHAYQGDSELALERFESCLDYFGNEDSEWRVCVAQSIAMLRLDRHQVDGAREALVLIEASSSSPISQPTLARVELARAELASQLGNPSEAEFHFAEAGRIFGALGEPTELAMVLLFEVRHHLRHDQPRQAFEKGGPFASLANDPRLSEVGRAILLEIARLCFRGELTMEPSTRAIFDWLRLLPGARCHESQPS